MNLWHSIASFTRPHRLSQITTTQKIKEGNVRGMNDIPACHMKVTKCVNLNPTLVLVGQHYVGSIRIRVGPPSEMNEP